MDRKYLLFAFRIMADIGASIAIPVVLCSMAGKALDARYGTAPWLLIAGFALAAAVSAVVIAKKARRYGEEYEKL
jgi:F0F1-type ATP synthase assembly protein I